MAHYLTLKQVCHPEVDKFPNYQQFNNVTQSERLFDAKTFLNNHRIVSLQTVKIDCACSKSLLIAIVHDDINGM